MQVYLVMEAVDHESQSVLGACAHENVAQGKAEAAARAQAQRLGANVWWNPDERAWRCDDSRFYVRPLEVEGLNPSADAESWRCLVSSPRFRSISVAHAIAEMRRNGLAGGL